MFPETENIIIQAKIDDVEESYNNSLSKESLDRERVRSTDPSQADADAIATDIMPYLTVLLNHSSTRYD